ncbi:MAG: 6-phosphogluconolactonase [Gemmobacter sp.]
MEFREYPDREFLFLSLADRIAGQLADFLRRQGQATLCLPGGSTPGPLYDILSGVDIDWPNVTVLLNDDRWVAETDARSNAGLVRRRLLRGAAVGARLVPIVDPAATPEEAAPRLSEAVAPHLPISVLLAGMGEDGHTASLFPGGDRLAQALAPDAPVLVPMTAPGVPEPRITLSARVLAEAFHIHLLIVGAEKRAALDRALAAPVEQAPVRAILGEAVVHWAE